MKSGVLVKRFLTGRRRIVCEL